ncbi:MAG TPA: hypothetical protein PLT75_16775 [Spirochaetota bacterium]|nr:hypothetical protein [Spirochaetota bacterium]
MKRILIPVVIMLLLTPLLYAQNMQQLQFIHQLADKQEATFNDAVTFMTIAIGLEPKDFSTNLQILKNRNIARGMSYNAVDPIRRGALSLMIARYLDLSDSLLYLIFGTERYAFRACVADGIMSNEGSEWDRLSGGELIEIMNIAIERAGGR